MSAVIIPKKSSVASNEPTTGDLQVGEIAVNLADTKIFSKDGGNNIVTLSFGEDTALLSGANTFTGSNRFSNVDNYSGARWHINATSSNRRLTGGGGIEIRGGTASYNITVQDGSGRVQHRWNATHGTSPTYQVSNERAAAWEINDVTDIAGGLWRVQYADQGTAGDAITWTDAMRMGNSIFQWMGNDIYHTGNDSNLAKLDGTQAFSAVNTFNAGVVATDISVSGALTIESTAPQINFSDTAGSDFYIHVNNDIFYVLADRDDNGGWETPHPLALNSSNDTGQLFGVDIITAAGGQTIGGTLAATGTITTPHITTNSVNDRVKIGVWNVENSYGFGMTNFVDYGFVGYTTAGAGAYAMTSVMSGSEDRGWWWGDNTESLLTNGAMSLTLDGQLYVDQRISSPVYEARGGSFTAASETANDVAMVIQPNDEIAVETDGYVRNLIKMNTTGDVIEIGQSGTSFFSKVALLPGAGNRVDLGNLPFDTSTNPGASENGHVLTYDSATDTIKLAASAGAASYNYARSVAFGG